MNLGWLDVCLRVESVSRSRAFYEDLGFKRAEGSDEEGWAVVVNQEARLGLFEPKFMGDERVILNFRGGDVMDNASQLQAKGHSFLEGPSRTDDGGASATLIDHDGHRLFMDTGAGETKKLPPQ